MPEIERAIEFAQTLKKRAVIAFEGKVPEATRFRTAAGTLLRRTKREKFYRITRRAGQVFIWKAADLA
jgi:hypothetical protein